MPRMPVTPDGGDMRFQTQTSFRGGIYFKYHTGAVLALDQQTGLRVTLSGLGCWVPMGMSATAIPCIVRAPCSITLHLTPESVSRHCLAGTTRLTRWFVG